MSPPPALLALVLVTTVAAVPAEAVPASRQSVFFGYSWRFHLQDPAEVQRSSTCAFTKSVTNRTCVGQSLHEDTNHWTPEDCELSCCADPTCMVWQYFAKDMVASPGQPQNWAQGRCLHGGSDVHCNSSGSKTLAQTCAFDAGHTKNHCIGGQRSVFQPLRRDWPFVARSFDDGSWPAVDVPNDFVINGSFAPDDDAHRAFLPRGVGKRAIILFSYVQRWSNYIVFLCPALDTGK
eukprot:SAG31_NODE_66_length_28567_cov_30.222698_21_plen_235_part_00